MVCLADLNQSGSSALALYRPKTSLLLNGQNVRKHPRLKDTVLKNAQDFQIVIIIISGLLTVPKCGQLLQVFSLNMIAFYL